MSTSESAAERKSGLDFLRQVNPERDLMMECADVRTAGIPGLFIRIEPTTQRQLYFLGHRKPSETISPPISRQCLMSICRSML